MGESPTFYTATGSSRTLVGRRARLKLLSKPSGHISGMAQDNLGYQMQYSVKVLEERLAQEGNSHVLQLNLAWEGTDWQNPTFWHLDADGSELLEGDGDFARQCFVEDAEEFLGQCREAIETSDLPRLTASEYQMLRCARDIARHESWDDGSHALGGRPGRVF